MNLSWWTFRWKWSPMGKRFPREGQPSVCTAGIGGLYHMGFWGVTLRQDLYLGLQTVFEALLPCTFLWLLPYPSSSLHSPTSLKKTLPSLTLTSHSTSPHCTVASSPFFTEIALENISSCKLAEYFLPIYMSLSLSKNSGGKSCSIFHFHPRATFQLLQS